MIEPDPVIVCVDCGGNCYPLGWFPGDGPLEVGTVLPYRCKDCLDRWDIVIGNWEDDANPDRPQFDADGFRDGGFGSSGPRGFER